jgi:hypothetical protein
LGQPAVTSGLTGSDECVTRRPDQATLILDLMNALRHFGFSLGTARQRLAERVRKRGIARVVYFHTDHFEPCRNFDGRPIFGDANIADVERFSRATEKIEFARRLTLFYKPQLNFEIRDGADMLYASSDDKLGFVARTPQDMAIAKAMMRPLVEGAGHEIQLHVHHENYTANATVTASGTPIGKYLCTAEGHARDSARFDFAVRLNLDLLTQEAGKAFDRWFFVHGHWALNASDDKDCRIVDEIEILYRNGCRGDFTFPAGRAHVDSRHHLPYLCKPVNVPKGYDTPAAEPEPAAGAGVARGEEKFLIWGSLIKHGATSIDHLSGFVQKRADNIEGAAAKIIDTSYLHDGTLFVKTHAHCMHPAYFNGAAPACFPHEYPATRDMLALVFDAGADAHAEIAFETVNEVYHRLLTSKTKPQVDMLAAFSSPATQRSEPQLLVRPSPSPAKPIAAAAKSPTATPILQPLKPATALLPVKAPAIQYAPPTRQRGVLGGIGGWMREKLRSRKSTD